MKPCIACVVFGCIVLASSLSAFGGEEKIPLSEVPRSVVETIKLKYAKAKMLGFERDDEGGQLTYEVKIRDGKRSLEVSCAPDGKILAEEERIALSAMPDEVVEALRASAKYGDWTLRQVERVVLEEKDDAPTYELQVAKDGASAELVFTASGSLIESEGHQAPVDARPVQKK